jgi:hypothetical protein
MQPGRVAGGYRSGIDGSVQPYGLILPKDFGQERGKKYRVDVVLHGRDASLTEVKFLHQNDPSQPAPEQDFIQLNIYGRGNNAYRWAGERDVFEALTGLARATDAVDPKRIVLRGFSMGGAGAWHLGLHYPQRWCSVSPGAGFTTTKGYAKSLPEPLPPYQESCLHIYDAVDYAENAFNVPIVAYGGDKDPQLQAARNIEAKLKPLNIPMTLLVGPNTEHRYHPDSLKEIMRLQAEHAAKGVPAYPSRVRFVTHCWSYPTSHWVTVLAPERQYERTLVDAERIGKSFRVKTANARLLSLTLPEDTPLGEIVPVEIDGQRGSAKAWPEYPDVPNSLQFILLERRDGLWTPGYWPKYQSDVRRRDLKTPYLSGPIDAAFASPFLCVRPAGKGWHDATRKYAEADLMRFAHEWSKYYRGDLPVVDADRVTPLDLETKNLILFGDPASNPLIQHALDRLPLTWTRGRIDFAGKQYPSASHVPAMIYPSPFSANRYIVLNSGHTFHAAEFEGTNALLFPRLGDYAILKLSATEKEPTAIEVTTAGLFDERWRVGRSAR